LIPPVPYRPLLLSENKLFPILRHPITLASKTYTIGQVVFAILQNLKQAKESLPPYFARFIGSSLTHFFATRPENKKRSPYNDFDMKITFDSSGWDNKTLIATIEALFFQALSQVTQSFPQNPYKDFQVRIYKPVIQSAKSFTSYIFSGTHPFEISILLSNQSSIRSYALNIDSLYIPLNSWDHPPSLGTDHPKKYALYSHENHAGKVVCAIKKRLLIFTPSNSIGKNGWTRLILAVGNGFTKCSEEANALLRKESIKENSLYTFDQFVQKKFSLLHYDHPQCWRTFICNAIFHSLEEDEMQSSLLRHLLDLVTVEKTLPWLSFFQKIPLASLSRRAQITTLKLLLPILAEKIAIKKHLDRLHMQCQFPQQAHPERPLYIVVPFLEESDLKVLPEVLLLLSQGPSPLFPAITSSVSNIKSALFPHHAAAIKAINNIKAPFCQEVASHWTHKFPSLQAVKEKKLSPLNRLKRDIKAFISCDFPAKIISEQIGSYAKVAQSKIIGQMVKKLIKNGLLQEDERFWEHIRKVAIFAPYAEENAGLWQSTFFLVIERLFEKGATTEKNACLSLLVVTLIDHCRPLPVQNEQVNTYLKALSLIRNSHEKKALFLICHLLSFPDTNCVSDALKDFFSIHQTNDPLLVEKSLCAVSEDREKLYRLLLYARALAKDFSSFLPLLELCCKASAISAHHKTSVGKSILSHMLLREPNYPAAVLQSYTHLYTYPEIALFLEEEFLSQNSYLKEQTKYCEALFFRIGYLSKIKSLKETLRLFSYLPQTQRESIKASSYLHSLFLSYLGEQDTAYQIASFTQGNFSCFASAHLFLDFLQKLQSPYTHRFILEIAKAHKELLSSEIIQAYCTSFISEFSALSQKKEPIELGAIARFYLAFAQEEQKLFFAYQCCLLSSPLASTLFLEAICSIYDYEKALLSPATTAWPVSVIATWIQRSQEASIKLEKGLIRHFLFSLSDYTKQEEAQLIIKIIPLFNEELGEIFAGQVLSQGEKLLLDEMETATTLHYLSFLMHKDISAYFLKTPHAFAISLLALQCCDKALTSSLSRHNILQIIDYGKSPLFPPRDTLYDLQASIFSKSISLLSDDIPSSYDFSFLAHFIAKKIMDPSLQKLGEVIGKTSHKCASILLESLCNHILSHSFSKSHFVTLLEYLSFKSFTLSPDLIESLLQYICELQSKHRKQKTISLCSSKIIRYALKEKKSDSMIKACKQGILHVHNLRIESAFQEELLDIESDALTYYEYLEVAISSYKILDDISFLTPSLLYDALRKQEEPKELLYSFTQTLSKVCVQGNEGPYPIKLARFGLKILVTPSIDKRLSIQTLGSQLMLFILQSATHHLVLIDLLRDYMRFFTSPKRPMKLNLPSDFCHKILQKITKSTQENFPCASAADETPLSFYTGEIKDLFVSSYLDYLKAEKRPDAKIKQSFMLELLDWIISIKTPATLPHTIEHSLLTIGKQCLLAILDHLIQIHSIRAELVHQIAIKLSHYNKQSINAAYSELLGSVFFRCSQGVLISPHATLEFLKGTYFDKSKKALENAEKDFQTVGHLFAPFINVQLFLHHNFAHLQDLSLRIMLDFYLELLEIAPKSRVPIQLIKSFIQDTHAYTSDTTNSDKIKVLSTIAKAAPRFYYIQKDLEEKIIDAILNAYEEVLQSLEGKELEVFMPVVTMLRKTLAIHKEMPPS
jgi:hypothetical protein